MTIYHINYWSQVDYCKHFRKLWNGPFCWNKSRCSSPLVSVATFWKSSNTKACIKKLSEILENIIGNGGKGLVAEFMRYFKYHNFHFLKQIYPKRVFPVERRKSEHDHWILNIRVSANTKIQLKLEVLIF